jgi:hypothetical protein
MLSPKKVFKKQKKEVIEQTNTSFFYDLKSFKTSY